MSTKPKGPSAAAPMIKNASAAPFIHFDDAPIYGTFAGQIEVELVARALMPKPGGEVVAEGICTAHLRCAPSVAIALADALQKAVAMLKKQQADTHAAAEEQERVPAAKPADKAA